MSDEQFQKLIESLTPEEKGRWQALLDNALGLVLGALAVGFFALLWQSKNDEDNRAAKLETRASSIEQSILGLQDTLKKEIGDLALPVAVQGSIQEAVTNQTKVIQELAERLEKLELKTNNATVESRASAMATNDSILKVQPFPTVKSEEVLKAIRAKEDSIDQRLRSFQQRPVQKD